MKSQILQILQMQQDGKITQDQAAELLAVLADQAREKDGASGDGSGGKGATGDASSEGAPGPRGDSPNASSQKPCGTFTATAASAIHNLVDSAIGMGTTVGRVAGMWGEEFMSKVHRDEGGNSITLSHVSRPQGDAYTFRGNTINVSKVAHITLQQAEFCGNILNASKLDHLSFTRARFSQCNISGSALVHLNFDGPENAIANGSNEVPITGIRNVTFNATKFGRATLSGGSALESSTIQAAAVKDFELSNGSLIKDSRITDSTLTGTRLDKATFATVVLDRSAIHGLVARDVSLDRVTFSATKISDLTLAGGTWTNVRFRRDSGGIAGIGTGRESAVTESTFDHCTLENCDFAGCTFRRTTLRNLKLTNITVRNVDFTGLTLDTEEAFRRAAGL